MSVVALSFVRSETTLYRKYQCSLKTGHVNAFVSSWRFAGTSLIRAIFVGFIEDMIHLTVTRQKQVEKQKKVTEEQKKFLDEMNIRP